MCLGGGGGWRGGENRQPCLFDLTIKRGSNRGERDTKECARLSLFTLFGNNKASRVKTMHPSHGWKGPLEGRAGTDFFFLILGQSHWILRPTHSPFTGFSSTKQRLSSGS